MDLLARRLSICLSLLIGILLASCTAPPIHMEIEDVGGRKVVTLFTLGLFGWRSSDLPCVRTITISSFDAVHEPHPAWSAAVPEEAQCIRMRSFVIGRTPPGFIQSMPLAAGEMRGRFRVEVVGIGDGVYDIVF
jgi:hypothetical protein